MPSQRMIAAASRRAARERFAKARIVEREFSVALAKVGRQVGMIVDGFQRDGIVTDPVGLRKALDLYSQTLAPWAKAVVERMQSQVSRRDLTAWKRLSESIGSNLHRQLQTAPIGTEFRSLMALQVNLITSLPIEAANRVHELTIEGLTGGRRAEDIAKEIMNSGHVTVSRGRLIAVTEVARTASVLVEARARYVGSPGYWWRTVGDEAVRPEHRKLEGKFITWDNPPISGYGKGGVAIRAHAGRIWRDRCWTEPSIPDL